MFLFKEAIYFTSKVNEEYIRKENDIKSTLNISALPMIQGGLKYIKKKYLCSFNKCYYKEDKVRCESAIIYKINGQEEKGSGKKGIENKTNK